MRSQPFRNPTGGAIDRSRVISFRFDGRAYQGYAGDTLASALLANGVRIVARSFKYHRPRGIFAAGAEEPNALVRVGEGARADPNLKATQVELSDGLVAESQNCWPSPNFDVGALAALFSPLLPAGFYYKTFKWPPSFWRRVYEPLIRRAAGMGRASLEPDPDRYDHCEAHCDVLVVGAGVTGLMAALEAGKDGARVIVADERPAAGGMLACRREKVDGMPAAEWVRQAVERLGALPEVRLLTRTTAFGYYDHNQVALLQRVAEHRMPRAGEPRQRLWHVRARQVVLATGAHERSMIFADNDRPGVMLANAAQEYVNRYAVRPGRTAVVFTNNDSAYDVALDLVAGGVPVAALVDVREAVGPSLSKSLAQAGIRHWPGAAVTGVHGARGVKAVRVAQLSSPARGAHDTLRSRVRLRRLGAAPAAPRPGARTADLRTVLGRLHTGRVGAGRMFGRSSARIFRTRGLSRRWCQRRRVRSGGRARSRDLQRQARRGPPGLASRGGRAVERGEDPAPQGQALRRSAGGRDRSRHPPRRP